jgi:hypothetical protein
MSTNCTGLMPAFTGDMTEWFLVINALDATASAVDHAEIFTSNDVPLIKVSLQCCVSSISCPLKKTAMTRGGNGASHPRVETLFYAHIFKDSTGTSKSLGSNIIHAFH